MRFSIVTPVLNGMPWLPDAIASVTRQRDQVELEHIVLDGGSDDGSREWLAAHQDLGYRLRLEPDDGQTDALRRGFDEATGDYFGWLNADDVLEPGALAVAAAALDADPGVVMVSGACLFIDRAGRITGAMATPPDPTLRGLLRVRINPPQPSTLFRASAYRAIGGLDLSFDLAMDLDLWLRLAAVGSYAVLSDQVLARYRVHPASRSERAATMSAREDLRARRRAGMHLRSPAGVALVRAGYVDPVVRPVAGLVRGLARRVVIRR